MYPIIPLGFSLLEVLISLILFSIALLGLDLMEVFSLHQIRNTFDISMAEQQLHNIEERLRMIADRGDLAEQINQWNQENHVVLPQGRGEVIGSYPHYQITIFWGDEAEKQGSHRGWLSEKCWL